MGRKVTSTEIKVALAEKHSRDFFIPECKNGSTYFPPAQGLLKFDGLAIRKSYTQPCITIYEIKVSRGDFLQDPKWHLYLQYCNEFYFVVPKGLVKKEEIPEGSSGLIYYDPEKGTLKTVRKALWRKIDEPIGVYKYIIYSRLDPDRIPFYESKAEYAKAYLEDRATKRSIGYSLGSKLAKKIEQYEKDFDSVAHYKEYYELCNELLKVMEKHGVLSFWLRDKNKAVEALDEALSRGYPIELDDITDQFKRAVNRLEKLKGERDEQS